MNQHRTISHIYVMNMIPWAEKYRPDNFDKIVLDPTNRRIFENILEHKYFPNLLLYGPPGTGKTTTIINLINEFQTRHFQRNKGLIIHLNASDERGIDIVRNQIHTFVKSRNLFDVGPKFVILDEVDYMTKNAQHALKYLLQTCSSNVKFCLICNYISKIEGSLQNEFTSIRFNQLPTAEILRFIRTISEAERMNLSDETIRVIQSIYNSDIRSMINFMQLNQNISSTEWEGKIISHTILDNIHNRIQDTSDSVATIIDAIYTVSVTINMDRRTILNNYFDYVIRNKPECVSSEFLHIIDTAVHCSDADPDTVVRYVCHHLRGLVDN